jgi:predicted phage terminase large subunit-like protein
MQIDVTLHNAQTDIIKSRKRFNTIRCGRRFGKSTLAFALALECMLSLPNALVLYTAPSNEDLKGRYQEAKQLFTKLGAECKEGEIKLGNSVLSLKGIWRADALRGNKYHRVILDEWAHCDNAEDAWNFVIRPTLNDYKGDAFFLSTPKGKNHFHQIDKYSESFADWKSFHFTSYDNPLIDASEIDSQKYVLPSIVFAQEYLAEYVDRDASKIKREWLKIANDKECIAHYIGVDLAIGMHDTNDYTAICVIGVTADKEIVIKEVRRGRWSFVDIGKQIVDAESKWQPKIVAIESNQAQAWLVQELKRNTRINVIGIHSHRDKITRFQPVEARYEQGLVYHVPHLLPEFTDELLSFTGTKQDKHDDMIDALSMAFSVVKKNPSILI